MIYNIFFIHKERGLNLLQHSFSGSKLDEDLVSGFISAIISFIDSLIPPTKDYRKEKLIRTVDRGDFKILIEAGEHVFGILFVNIEKVEVRTKLKEIIQEFEQTFDLKNWDGTIEVQKFESFKEIIFKKFASEIIQVSDVPVLTPSMKEFLASHDELDLLGLHNISAGLLELLLMIDGTSDVQEIANRLECPVDEVIEKVGYLFELGDLITIESPVYETDIFVLTPEAMPIFRLNTYERETILNLFGKEGIDVLLNIDGARSVKGIQKKTGISFEKIKEILRFCSFERLVKRIRVHPIIQKPIEVENFAQDEELSVILRKIVQLCDGNHSLREIAKNLKVPINVITDFLVVLGDNVEWLKK
ncbi:MAG: hypothetical protein ACTSYB_03550 [Candidatus Helarchaeota archaeon]